MVLLAGCEKRQERSPAVGQAYAGSATVNLRKDIPLQSPVVATVKFGDRLEIIQHRRRFFKVRTERGVEGWTDERLLLSAEDIAGMKGRAEKARGLPSQGVASTYDLLNVHTDPDRQSPSFLQIKEGEKVDVLAHRVAPRIGAPQKPLIPRAPKKAPLAKKKKKEVKYPPPPMPQAPRVPSNWMDLSKTPPEVAEEIRNREKPAVPMDDWSLIRTSTGQTGWVLTRRIYMAIPDEVAQYAEGHRITAYFPLGDVPDGGTVKHNWFWTTISEGLQSHDFDSFRVFIWSMRRHRYETAHIERNLTGYFPVLSQPVDFTTTFRGKSTKTTYPGFSVCVEKKDGQRYRRSYAFIGNVVRFAGERPCEVSAVEERRPSSGLVAAVQSTPSGSEGKSLIDRFKAWRKRLFGK